MWFKKETVIAEAVLEVKKEAPRIRRMGSVTESGDDSLSSPVLAEARELLGYDPEAVAGQVLREAFKRIGIEYLNRDDVDAYKDWMVKKNKNQMWRYVPVKEYFAPVPFFALSQAISIKRELPEAEIFVEYFGHDPDPFMAVLYRHTWYYFAAWDEPEFEGRSTV